jgi:hypothetical protein
MAGEESVDRSQARDFGAPEQLVLSTVSPRWSPFVERR